MAALRCGPAAVGQQLHDSLRLGITPADDRHVDA